MKYGIVGDGLVASIFKNLSDFEVVHRDGWNPIRWDGLVNCAAQSSRIACENVPFLDVLKANTILPVEMYEATRNRENPVPFIQFSTSALYKHPPHPDTPLDEHSEIYPLHSYGASKMLMEQMLSSSESYIFRIPRVVTDNGHPGDFKNHIANWTHVEDRNVSIVRGDTIVEAVRSVLTGDAPPGIYNIATEIVNLPEIVASYGITPEIIPADSMEGLGPWPILDTGKAYRYGLI